MSNSFANNAKILQREVKLLYELGAKNAIQFDLEKTELIHFGNTKQAKTIKLELPNNIQLSPKPLVRWLGIWFDSKLSFKEHLNIRIAQAKTAFHRLARLTNCERGLSPLATRQLYLACVASISDYGSPIWWQGQLAFITKLKLLQNLALRKILGVFKTAPIVPMEVEAAIPPIAIRLNTTIRQYAFRLAKLSRDHPVNKELIKLELYTQAPLQESKLQLAKIH